MIVAAICVLLAIASIGALFFVVFMLDWVAHALGFLAGSVVLFYFGEWLATGNGFLRGFQLAAYYTALLPGFIFLFAFGTEPIREWFADVASFLKLITWSAWLVALVYFGAQLDPF